MPILTGTTNPGGYTHVPLDVAFVDSISATATVRLSLTDAPWKVGRGFDLSPPPLRRSVASSMLTDGARISAASYDNRTIGLPLTLRSTDADDMAAALQDLARELDRPTNILRVMIGTTPVFFRTFRAPDYVIAQVLGLYQVDFPNVVLPAEPFGLGLRVDLGPYTINNDPAHATNPQKVVLPAITGDVETPAYVFVSPTVTDAAQPVTSMLVASRGPTTGTSLGYALVQVESMTLGTDTTLPGADAAMSGSGSNYARCSFATATAMSDRLLWDLPIRSLQPDRYTVVARVRRSVSGDVVKMRYGQSNNNAVGPGTYTYSPAVTLPSGTGAALVRLGTVQIPFGASMRENGYSGTVLPGYEQFAIQAQRVSGSGNLDIDYIAFIRADAQLLTSKLPAASGGFGPPASVCWDGVSENVRLMHVNSPFAATNSEMSAVVEVAGRFPSLSPSGENVLHFFRNVDRGTDTFADVKTDTAVLSVSYWPRYLVTP